MTAPYIKPGEFSVFGIPAGQEANVLTASAILDAYLYRPEGLVWVPDASGQPCYMAGKNTVLAVTSTDSISPGQNVTVQVTGPAASMKVGDVLVLDRYTPNAVEACTIASSAVGSVTLEAVQYAHAPGIKMESGLVLDESKQLSKGRNITHLSRAPAMRILSALGRYGYGRRGDFSAAALAPFNLMAAVSQFGGPPVWERINPPDLGLEVSEAAVWVPTGALLSAFTEVKLQYVAGYPFDGLPDVIKVACATLTKALMNQPAAGSVKTYKAGDTAVQNFTNSVFDDDTKQMLNPFSARMYA